MEKSEKNIEKTNQANEKNHIVKERRDVRRAVENRAKQTKDKASTGETSTEKQSRSGSKEHRDIPNKDERIQNLKANLRVIEADRTIEKNQKKFNRELCPTGGTESHKQRAVETRIKEAFKGRKEGKDFDVEKPMRHPDKKKFEKPDEIDYQKGVIKDLKQIGHDETPEQLLAKNKKQRTRQIEAAEHSKKKFKVNEYHYPLEPSMKDYDKIKKGEFSRLKKIIIKRNKDGSENKSVEYRIQDGDLSNSFLKPQKRKEVEE